MGITDAQAAAFYFARKHHRAKHAKMFVTLSPRAGSILQATLAADTEVAQVSNYLAVKKGVTTITLGGANAASFVLAGRSLRAKSGTVLVAGTPLTVDVTVSNSSIPNPRGTSSARFILTVN